MIVSEALSREEEEQGRTLIGAPGWLLKQILSMHGIAIGECYVTKVFNLRPPGNDIKSFCGGKLGAIPGFPALASGKYVRAEFRPELDRLESEIARVRPNLILALGGTASWFLLQDGRISKIRGSLSMSRFGIKVLPTYHPAAVLREWSLRPILIADLAKAAREQDSPELRRPQRFIHIEPTLADIKDFYLRYIAPSDTNSVDVETISNQITCIGFAPSPERALVIPFYDPSKPDGNYWDSLSDELAAWRWVKRILAEDKIIIGQNFTYDAKFLMKSYGIFPVGMERGDDTMLLHHALQPELQKGLAFLGSIYTDEAAWKLERKNDSIKKED